MGDQGASYLGGDIPTIIIVIWLSAYASEIIVHDIVG